MRFSLKWLLAGMVYVAIAAAAFSFAEKTWIYCDVLWGLTLLILVYSGVVVLCASGRRRATAAGFLFACILYLGILAVTEGKTTGGMILNAVGVRAELNAAPVLMGSYYYRPIPAPPVRGMSQGNFNRLVRAANAVATLAFGLMGSLAGLMAFRAIET